MFGDVAEEAGEKIVASLGKDRATFIKTNVTNYTDHVTLFKTALEKHGHVDHAVPVAGIAPKDNWFLPHLTVEDVDKPESELIVDINLKGVLYFTRVALPYLRHGAKEGDRKSLTLISSVAGFLNSPHIPVYSVTKHGVMGLMRSLRESGSIPSKLRVNSVNPAFVSTAMTASFAKTWRESGMPENTPEYIAEVCMGLACQGVNGKAMYVSGNQAWDIEEGLSRTAPDWMGEAYGSDPEKRLAFTSKVQKAGDLMDLDEKVAKEAELTEKTLSAKMPADTHAQAGSTS